MLSPVSASSLEEQILKIQNAYEKIHDLKGTFTQKNTIKDLNRTDTYKGSFLIKYPLKMKWMYEGETSQDITINNDTVLIYKKGDRQAYRTQFDRATYGQTPVALLSGFGNIQEEFDVSVTENSMMLKPKRRLGNVASITILISESAFPIQAFTIQDGSSNIVEIELKDVKINEGLKDSLFDLSVPEGVDIYQQ